MEGILIVALGLSGENAETNWGNIAEQLQIENEAGAAELLLIDDSEASISGAILTCVKRGVVHLNVLSFLSEDDKRLSQLEIAIREEVENYRGMTVDFKPLRLFEAPKKLVKCIQEQMQKETVREVDLEREPDKL